MLKAITREEMVDGNGKLDIYSFMRSAEIREYMRQNNTFELENTIFIILKCMNPFEIKLEALKILASDQSLSDHDRRHVLYVAKYVERILQEIYSPESPAIIAMKECYCVDEEGLNAYEASVQERNSTGYYSSYNEFLEQYAEYAPEEDDELPRYEIDLVYQDKDTRHNNPISFSSLSS